jgi:hypothetical protein
MRESEMRQRIESLLRRRVLAPTLGLGLALVGCGGGGSEYSAPIPHHLDAGDVSHDASGPSRDAPVYSAVLPLDAAVVDAPATNEALPADAGNERAAALDAPLTVDQG